MTNVELEIIYLSLHVALITALCISIPAILTGVWLSQSTLRGRIVVEVLVSAPMVLPPVATGYLLILCLGHNGLLGRQFNGWIAEHLSIGFWGAAIASAVVSFPIFVRSVRVAAEGLDPGLITVARNLGVSRLRVFWRIILPLIWPGILSGFLLSFIRSIGEFGATVTFVGTMIEGSHTLSVALWLALQDPSQEQAALRLLFICLMLALAALALSEFFMKYFSWTKK